jgi:hypothetical protein
LQAREIQLLSLSQQHLTGLRSNMNAFIDFKRTVLKLQSEEMCQASLYRNGYDVLRAKGLKESQIVIVRKLYEEQEIEVFV